jgi:membrane protein DedA with SNARE-associated domain
MEASVEQFVEWMYALPAIWTYLILLGISYGENVLPVIPGDLLIVFTGYLAGVGQLSLTLVILIATLGGALGFMTMFGIGYRMGTAVLDPDRFKWVPKKSVYRTQLWLKKWGYGVILINRFLSGARSVIALTVGIARMDAPKTAAFSTVGAFVWTALITYLGYALGENWKVVGVYLQQYGQVIITLMVVGAVGWLALRVYRRYKGQRERGGGEEPAPHPPGSHSNGIHESDS